MPDNEAKIKRLKARIERSNKAADKSTDVSSNVAFGKRKNTLASVIGNSDLGQNVINRREERMDNKMKSVGIADDERNEYFLNRQRKRSIRGIQGGGRLTF
jgi:hypothetical protein